MYRTMRGKGWNLNIFGMQIAKKIPEGIEYSKEKDLNCMISRNLEFPMTKY